MPTKKAGMDWPMFSKLVRLAASSPLGDGTEAFRQAVVMGESNGMHFDEACAKAFGQSTEETMRDLEMARALIRDLEQEQERLEEEAKLLNEKLNAVSTRPPVEEKESKVKEFLRDLFSLPQTRLLALLTSVGLRFISHQHFNIASDWRLFGIDILDWFLFGAIFYATAFWLEAQYEKSLRNITLVKWIGVYIGIAMSFGMAFGAFGWGAWFGREAHLMNLGGGIVMLIIVWLLGISNAIEKLASKVVDSDRGLAHTFRTWFM
jgi:hypothetical protein